MYKHHGFFLYLVEPIVINSWTLHVWLPSYIVIDSKTATELPTLPDSAESSLKINQSFHALMNKFEIISYRNLFPAVLNVILYISLIVGQNVPDCKMQMLEALGQLQNETPILPKLITD